MTSRKLCLLGLAAICAVGMSGCGAGSENLPAEATRPVDTGAEIDAGRPDLDGGGPQTEDKKTDPTGGGLDYEGIGVKESSPPPPVPQVEDSLDEIIFEVAIHVATDDMDKTRKRIEQKIDTANEKFEGIAVGFEDVDEFHVLPEDFATLDNSPERHKLKKYLVDRAINIFVVDTILDPHPSGATKKAAAWQGRKPSGRLAGAHIEVKNKKPHTYIILKAHSSSVSLAHELGHFLGLPHHKDPANIMSYGNARQNFNDDQLEVMRRIAQKTKRKRLVRVID